VALLGAQSNHEEEQTERNECRNGGVFQRCCEGKSISA
jgi:hypothetical protein